MFEHKAELTLIERKLRVKLYEDFLKERAFEKSRVDLEFAIEKTYDDIINLYKAQDLEMLVPGVNVSFLKRSYASRAGGIITRRNNLKRELRILEKFNG